MVRLVAVVGIALVDAARLQHLDVSSAPKCEKHEQPGSASLCKQGLHKVGTVCANAGRQNEMQCLDLEDGFQCATPACVKKPVNHTFGECHCAFTSGNKDSCCAEKDDAGMGTGTFCGNNGDKMSTCGGDKPVCCTSLSTGSQCCPAGSACSASCGGDGGTLKPNSGGDFGRCRCLPPPKPSKASELFSMKLAKAFAGLARASYCGPDGGPPELIAPNPKGILTWTCEKECAEAQIRVDTKYTKRITKTDFENPNATFAYVSKLTSAAPENKYWPRTGDCVAGIAGSSNWQNWKRNFQWGKMKAGKYFESMKGVDEEAHFHQGFAKVWKALADDEGDGGVVQALKDLGCGPGTGKQVFITGQSLGAATAQVAMLDLKVRGFNVGLTYVYGTPRVGNAEMREVFNTAFGREVSHYRVTNRKDPIPRFGAKVGGHRHLGAEAYFAPNWDDKQLDVSVCQKPEDTHCSFRYNFPATWAGGDDHCGSPLSPDGLLCGVKPPQCM
jgi:hypothetical protein